ncbi:SbcC/MukB-like Walker B domain-containing protein [Levilactobacillus suantsaii]|uniref:Nuclease SbcCD subunit C n=1 Tax=Levilactobacillus suantsaii TaxID=2292255 RepID=A0A4Q0VIH8_9LACO|nr:SMC family ATPase [Levilactobacillus suantsaii]QMU07660.1 SMC family ATPase [Levilactobacillus suantsaii]RXI78641.1 SMC family ATPase [Levilactobacillus suantsaii]
MKPVYLKMTYFGPYQEAAIDFRQLEEAPIFLIGGDTGAGKSTIFDAMTYALFGSTTNDGADGRGAKELRSQFAPADQATTITFYFEQGNQLYKITRSPEQSLAKKRGNGTTKKNATATLATMTTVGGTETASIAAKPADVGPEIMSILNLNADQFKKIILLPQNDFSEFLKAKTTDKERILKKIFGTQLYTDFTAKLKERYDAASQTGQQFTNQLTAQLTAATWTPTEQDQLQQAAAPEQPALLKAFVTQRQQTLTKVTANAQTNQQALDHATAAYQQGRDIDQKFKRLATTKADYQQKITAQKPQIAAQEAQLSKLRWAATLSDTVRDYQQAQADQQHLKQAQTAAQTAAVQANDRVEQAQQTQKKLTDQAADFDQQQHRVDQLITLIPQAQKVEDLTTQVAQLQPTVTQAQKQYTDQKAQIDTLAATITQQRAALAPVDELRTTKDHLTQQRSQAVDTLTPLFNQQQTTRATVKRLQADYDQAQTAQQDRQNQLTAAQTDFQTQKGRRQDLMIAQLQQELVNGEPCVVCGSLDHSHMQPHVAASETELKAAMTAVDASQNTLAAAQKSVANGQEQIQKLQTELATAQQDQTTATTQLTTQYQQLRQNTSLISLPQTAELKTIKAAFDQQLQTATTELKQAEKAAQTVQALETQLTTKRDDLNAAQVTLAQQQATLKGKQSDLQAAQKVLPSDAGSSAQLAQEKTQLTQAIATYTATSQKATTETHQAQLDQSTTTTKLEDLNQQLTAKQHQVTALNDSLTAALNAMTAPTQDLATLQQWLADIADGTMDHLQTTITSYHRDAQNLTATIEALESELSDQTIPDLAALKATLATQQAQRDELIREQANATTAAKTAQASYQQIQQILRDQGDFAKRFAELTGLYNIVTGKDGNDQKLKLETYVVQNYLQRVLTYANEHFINLLSNNRYTFELAAKVADHRTDHGLDIYVFDNETGHSRSADTLSGGETFIAALSIALSLSEVVQSSANGVQIDALFVDEGFGSLDDETLEKAMQALETIGENRMVGVISHIESMKRTIGQQVLIQKLGDGRSQVKLISK